MTRNKPMIWAGVDASSILDELTDYPDSRMIDFLKEERIRIMQMIQAHKEWESRSRGQFEPQSDEGFE